MAAEAEADRSGPAPPDSAGSDPPASSPEGAGASLAASRDASREALWESAELRYGYLIAVSAAVFALDQASKAVVKSTMQLGDVIPLLPPVLDLRFITNRGVAFGLFASFGDVFVPVAIVIMTIITLYYRSLRGRRLWLRTALALQLGGALGNLVDRLRYGAVVDFLDFHIDAINFNWPVFNLADVAIVLGVGILLVCLTTQPE